MRPYRLQMALLMALSLGSCDDGLAPPSVEPGLAGHIIVAPGSIWPPADSVEGLWLFASREYPLDSSKVITGVLIEPRTIYLYPSLTESLPYGVDSVAFRFALAPGTYRFIGIIQQLRPALIVQNFRVIAMLADPGNPATPRSITVEPENVVQGLRILIDFADPPAQPFEAGP